MIFIVFYMILYGFLWVDMVFRCFLRGCHLILYGFYMILCCSLSDFLWFLYDFIGFFFAVPPIFSWMGTPLLWLWLPLPPLLPIGGGGGRAGPSILGPGPYIHLYWHHSNPISFILYMFFIWFYMFFHMILYGFYMIWCCCYMISYCFYLILYGLFFMILYFFYLIFCGFFMIS